MFGFKKARRVIAAAIEEVDNNRQGVNPYAWQDRDVERYDATADFWTALNANRMPRALWGQEETQR
jgi:hypothetical protein